MAKHFSKKTIEKIKLDFLTIDKNGKKVYTANDLMQKYKVSRRTLYKIINSKSKYDIIKKSQKVLGIVDDPTVEDTIESGVQAEVHLKQFESKLKLLTPIQRELAKRQVVVISDELNRYASSMRNGQEIFDFMHKKIKEDIKDEQELIYDRDVLNAIDISTKGTVRHASVFTKESTVNVLQNNQQNNNQQQTEQTLDLSNFSAEQIETLSAVFKIGDGGVQTFPPRKKIIRGVGMDGVQDD